jgi:transcriptional regulator with XRE-family HTH domain
MSAILQIDKHPLREWRARQRVSLRDLAEHLQRTAGREIISYASLSRIESGSQQPSAAVMRVICDATNGEVTPNDLLGCGGAAP